MGPYKKPPILFANRIIRRFVDVLAGDDVAVRPDDYMAIRLIFRKAGGSWELVTGGDILHTNLLSKIVSHWAQMPGKQVDPDLV